MSKKFGLSKRTAQSVLEDLRPTIGQLRERLDHALAGPHLDEPSVVNPGLTHGQALGILKAGIASVPDNTPWDGGHGKRLPLIARNILREAGWSVGP